MKSRFLLVITMAYAFSARAPLANAGGYLTPLGTGVVVSSYRYALGSVWHSHPFNWTSGATFYEGVGRGPSIIDLEHPGRYTDAMMAIKFPKTVFSLRALGYIGTGSSAQEWYYYGEAAVYGFGVEQ